MASCGVERVTVVVGLLDPLVSRGLVDVLREDRGVLVLAAGLDRHALERVVVQSGPRVAVVGEIAGESLLVCLKANEPAPAVVVIAHRPTLQRGRWLLAAGATCIAQSADTVEILATIQRAARGGRAVVGAGRAEAMRRRDDPKRLTKRQAEVFRYLSEDRSYAVIALEMRIDVQTVRTHAKAVFRKLGVQSRQQLVGKSLPDGFRPALK